MGHEDPGHKGLGHEGLCHKGMCHEGTGHKDLGHEGLLLQGYTILPHGLLHNKIFKLKAVYQKLWTWSWTWNWKYNSTHQIGGGNKSITWTFAEIRQYGADYYDFEDGHKFIFMSNVHDDILVAEIVSRHRCPFSNSAG